MVHSKLTDIEIISLVRELAQNNPKLVPRMVMAMNNGLEAAFTDLQNQYADVESALFFSVSPDLKKGDKNELIKDHLIKHRERLLLKWNWYLGTEEVENDITD